MIETDNKILLSALKYAAAVKAVFPCNPDNKQPLCKGGFKSATTDADQISKWWQQFPRAMIGLPTGAINNIMVIDVDTLQGHNADGFKSLEQLQNNIGQLPETLIVSTPTGGRHIYFEHPGEKLKNSAGKLGEGLDTRADGGYVIAAPSITSKNTSYKIEVKHEIAPMPAALLNLLKENKNNVLDLKQPGKKTTKRKPGRPVAKGGRNHALTREAGHLVNQYKEYDEFASALMQINNGYHPPLDESEFKKLALNAWQNFERVPEGQTYINGFDYAGIDAALTEAYRDDNLFFTIQGGKAYYVTKNIDDKTKQEKLAYLARADFLQLYSNVRFQTGFSASTTPQYKSLATLIETDPNRKQYLGGITYEPHPPNEPDPTPADVYNQYRGYAVEPNRGDASLIYKHILEVLADNGPTINEYILNWIADSFQNPAKTAGVILIFIGDEGGGKGTICRLILDIVGAGGMTIIGADELTSQWNNHFVNVTHLFVDEAICPDDKQAISKLKSMATEPTFLSKARYMNAETVNNYLHIMMATNSAFVVNADTKSRRFCVLKISDANRGNKEYFNPLYEQINVGGKEAFLFDMLNRDLSNFDIQNYPVTTALIEQRENSLEKLETWWYSCLHTGEVDHCDENTITGRTKRIGKDTSDPEYPEYQIFSTTRDLHSSYSFFSTTQRENPDSVRVFSKKFSKYTKAHLSRVPATIQKTRPGGYLIGDLENARHRFCDVTGLPYDFDADDNNQGE